ncbi:MULTISPECIES: YdiU family protein [unclassified Endozoicomonas]|uniref:protein adenylyltransferase SelO n=1 Tax=unclassified Endozoicomonas TaxID=2644528 RepID=UPI00214734AD|nr:MULTISPECIES: YdiU family protein [unclassified Endozoicomonas]
MRTSLDQLNFNNRFGQLPDVFYTRLQGTPLDNPKLVAVSQKAADLLDLELSDTCKEQLTQMGGGSIFPEDSDPLAMIYSGHQFGSYNPQLGDGRGLLLGEVINKKGEIWDLHLKGAGMTPYSRFGDGRAVLRSCIREYLASEALFHLGIPTTRALCVVTSDTPVYRETEERGSTLLRMAKTHIRFGHFEYFYYTKQHEALETLVEFTIQNYFSERIDFSGQPDKNDKYSLFFKAVVEKTAHMIALWQANGFAHGVMNTDNMSILGETFDYGPYGFQDDFNWHFICNHSDHSGRYAFSQQPDIGYWNCGRLAQAFLPLLEDISTLQKILDSYPALYSTKYLSLMSEKLGLQEEEPEDSDLIRDLLQQLHDQRLDYTLFFRTLSDYRAGQGVSAFIALCSEPEFLKKWLQRYDERIRRNPEPEQQRHERMKQINPKYILRNYLAQTAIEKAEKGDYSEIDQLMKVLQSPYDEHPDLGHYAQKPPEWSKKLEVSCSS